MNKTDWILTALANAENNRLSPVQLQKALFLLSKNLDPAELGSFFEFSPYDYGPFSAEVYSVADGLATEGLVEIRSRIGEAHRSFTLTAAGLAQATDLEGQLAQGTREYIGKLVSWVTKLSFRDLVQAIYTAYPETSVNSVFRSSD